VYVFDIATTVMEEEEEEEEVEEEEDSYRNLNRSSLQIESAFQDIRLFDNASQVRTFFRTPGRLNESKRFTLQSEMFLYINMGHPLSVRRYMMDVASDCQERVVMWPSVLLQFVKEEEDEEPPMRLWQSCR
jgi:hypothetical protein